MDSVVSYLACGLTVFVSFAEAALFFGGFGFIVLEQKLKSRKQLVNITLLALLSLGVDKLTAICGQSELMQGCLNTSCIDSSRIIADVFLSLVIVACGYLATKKYLERGI